MSSSFVQVAAYYKTFFSYKAEQHSIVCIYHIFFNHSSIVRQLGCFHVLTIMNSAAVNVRVLVSPGLIPRTGIAGSYGNSIFNFFGKPW